MFTVQLHQQAADCGVHETVIMSHGEQGHRRRQEDSENNQTWGGVTRRSERMELRVEISKQREQGEEWEGGGHRVHIGVE